jgi:hypothetical protein
MTAATLPRMPRRAKKPDSAQEAPRPGTTTVRIAADLARMLSIISSALGEDVSEILSPHIRPFVEARYAEVVKQLGQEISRDKPGSAS